MKIALIAAGTASTSGVRSGSWRSVLLVLCAISAFVSPTTAQATQKNVLVLSGGRGSRFYQSDGVLATSAFFGASELLDRGSWKIPDSNRNPIRTTWQRLFEPVIPAKNWISWLPS